MAFKKFKKKDALLKKEKFENRKSQAEELSKRKQKIKKEKNKKEIRKQYKKIVKKEEVEKNSRIMVQNERKNNLFDILKDLSLN